MGRGGATKGDFQVRRCVSTLVKKRKNSFRMDFLRPYAPQGSLIEPRLIGMTAISVVDDLPTPGTASCALGRFFVWANRPPVRYGPL